MNATNKKRLPHPGPLIEYFEELSEISLVNPRILIAISMKLAFDLQLCVYVALAQRPVDLQRQ